MYRWFEIKNFKCFKDLKLDNLARINLIAGTNNSGKTALLEGIYLNNSDYNPSILRDINAFRGIEKMNILPESRDEHPIISFFYQYDISNTIETASEDTIIGNRNLKLYISKEPIKVAELSILKQFYEKETNDVIDSSVIKSIILKNEVNGKESELFIIMDKGNIMTNRIPQVKPFPICFLNSQERLHYKDQAEKYGKLQIQQKESDIAKALKIIEPRLNHIASIALSDGSILYGDVGIGRLIPLVFMGAGVDRLTNIILNIANAENGVVLIDEIENGLHYSIMSKIWKAYAYSAEKYNTQIFATTHSWECIRYAYKAFESVPKKDNLFRLFRLDRKNNGDIDAVSYDIDMLGSALEAGMEVR